MLFFRSEEAIERWCGRHGATRGESLTLNQLWELSKRWYHNRISPDYHGRTLTEIVTIFEETGLTSPFWRPSVA